MSGREAIGSQLGACAKRWPSRASRRDSLLTLRSAFDQSGGPGLTSPLGALVASMIARELSIHSHPCHRIMNPMNPMIRPYHIASIVSYRIVSQVYLDSCCLFGNQAHSSLPQAWLLHLFPLVPPPSALLNCCLFPTQPHLILSRRLVLNSRVWSPD